LASTTDNTDDFAFIAFNNLSGEAMAHGRLAAEALNRAGIREPKIGIEILATGDAGEWIWSKKLSLANARSTLKELGPVSIF
jgi:hypothetical protein